MELKELRQKISEVGFSEEIAAKLDEILAGAIAKGVLSLEDKAKMNELIDIDMEAGNLEADAMENMALMLGSLIKETEDIQENASTEEEKIADDAGKEADALEAEMNKLRSEQATPVQPTLQSVPQWNQSAAQTPGTPTAPAAPVLPWNQGVTQNQTGQ